MKLISLYIENFGGLNRYSLNFEDGLTVVQQPNGFGKTTLAEFIRAMFYGFPRKAKTLDKSRRQKYTPWQGGKFGGNLVFEYQGTRYRIERTFGATPRGDSFTLIDLNTNKKSSRFSENIGLELFRLDSDSFERSTYMPQLHDLTSLTTDGIQAKLGDLVEDTGDIGNYEKAVTALKTARSAFIPYRGSGGSMAEAQAQVSRLQAELDCCSGLEASLEDAQNRIDTLQQRQISRMQQREEIRNRILQASEAAAVAAAHREMAQLTAREAQLKAALDELNLRYPNGIPAEDQITLARDAAAKAAVLSAQQVTTQEDLDAEAFINENCARFEGRIPSREALEQCRGQISRHQMLLTQMQNTGLSDEENQQYRQLLPRFEAGQFDPTRLEKLDDASRELTRLSHKLEEITIADSDREQLEELKLYFAQGVPEEEAISRHREKLAESHGLRRKKAELLEELAGIQAKKAGPLLILSAILALAGIGAGIALLLGQLPVFGYAALGVGGVSLICAGVMLVKLLGSVRETNRIREELQTRIDEYTSQISALDQAVAGFTECYTLTRPLSDALIEIRDNRENLKKLAGGIASAVGLRKQLTGEIGTLRSMLTRELGETDFDRAILDLHLAAGQFRDLRQELEIANRKTTQMQEECDHLSHEITVFLGAYYDDPAPEQFHSLLTRLDQDAERYVAAQTKVDNWKQRLREHRDACSACEEVLHRFFETFGLSREENLREQLLRIRDDSRNFGELLRQHSQAEKDAAAYRQQNRNLLEKPMQEAQEDPALLRLTERQLTEEADTEAAMLLKEQQQLLQIRDRLSQIPGLQDELAQWQEKRITDKKKASILDDTMTILEKARENLQTSYLGPLKTSFFGYMQRLLGEDNRQILLTPDLEVQLERNGQARELAYFSAGQTDTVMLCMRLALVDALFSDVKPFVILDDPFVNLDDEHTAQALELLKELSRQRQILYLVCNSSRNYE